MPRPGRTTVDYFPHVTQTGKTMAILEACWGNDGYAFWFKTLELLGGTEGLCYNCNNTTDWEYLLSKTRVTQSVAVAILDKLAGIDAIDAELWKNRIIWSDHFAAALKPLFERRKSSLPTRPEVVAEKTDPNAECEQTAGENTVSAGFLTAETGKEEQSKVKESETGNPMAAASCTSSRRTGVEKLADTVYLKPAEAARLAQEYGQRGLARIVAILDAYKTNHPAKRSAYRDDYKVILAWVASRYLTERSEFNPRDRGAPLPVLPASQPGGQAVASRNAFGSLADALRQRLAQREQSLPAAAGQQPGGEGCAAIEDRG